MRDLPDSPPDHNPSRCAYCGRNLKRNAHKTWCRALTDSPEYGDEVDRKLDEVRS